MATLEMFGNTRDNVKHFQCRVKSHSLFSLIPEIFKNDFQQVCGDKNGSLVGCQAWKKRGLRTSIRKESEGRDGVKVKQLSPACN